MQHPAKTAALLSAFVFPGAGHFVLKRRGMGMLLTLGSIIPTLYLVYFLILSTQRLFTLLQKQLLPPDFGVMLGYVLGQPFGNGTPYIMHTILALLVFWVVGIVDSYRIGKQIEAQQA